MSLEQLQALRKPFPDHQISKLPKPTRAQTDAVKSDYKNGIRCKICGGWHHKDVIHLDYVGHAALTDRLLDVDPDWTWEPLALDQTGLPAIDRDGGLWIKLKICGVTRLGYGDAQGKTGGDAMKERIGDALRNAAMRFGCALDLWHKGDLHVDQPEAPAHLYTDEQKSKFDSLMSSANSSGMFVFKQGFDTTDATGSDANIWLDLVGSFPHGQKGKMGDALKAMLNTGREQVQGLYVELREYIRNQDDTGIQETLDGLSAEVSEFIKNKLTAEDAKYLQEIGL